MSRYSPTAKILARATVRYLNRPRPKYPPIKDVVGHNIAHLNTLSPEAKEEWLDKLSPHDRLIYNKRIARNSQGVSCLLLLS